MLFHLPPGGKESTVQRQVDLPVWNNNDCDRTYFQPINEDFICAGLKEGGKDACQVWCETSVQPSAALLKPSVIGFREIPAVRWCWRRKAGGYRSASCRSATSAANQGIRACTPGSRSTWTGSTITWKIDHWQEEQRGWGPAANVFSVKKHKTVAPIFCQTRESISVYFFLSLPHHRPYYIYIYTKFFVINRNIL